MSKKNSNGDGAIRQRSNGSWECMIMISRDYEGKRKYKSFYGKTREEVCAKRDAYYREQEVCPLDAQRHTTAQWIWKWYEHHREELKPATQESYRYTAKIISASALGNRDIKKVLAYDVECFLRQLKKDGYSGSMISKCRGMLHQAMRSAEANRLISKNPVALVEKMRKDPPTRKEVFSAEEVRLLMDKLPQDKIGWSIRLLLATGMRKQELLALEARHIAEDGSTIQIEQAVTRIKGTAVISSPKSFDSYRTIPVPVNVRACAIALREIAAGGYVWESPKNQGQPCNPSHFDDMFRRALKGVERVRVLTPHSCRHTYVSQMQALGVSMEVLQSIVGHADMDMTLHYLRMQEPQRQAAIEKFSDAFSTAERSNVEQS